MNKTRSIYYRLATVCTGLLSMMVIVFANTNSERGNKGYNNRLTKAGLVCNQ